MRARRGRPPAADALSEDEILTAALRSFAAHGYLGTSVRDLNADLGVSHNLIHRRFGSKLDLWKATADRWFGDFVAELDPVLDSIRPGQPLGAFRRFIVAFIETSASRPDLLRMMQLEGAIESERLDYVWERHVRAFGRRINQVVRTLEGSERYTSLPATTTFFLLAHGATAPSHPAASRRIEPGDPTDPVARSAARRRRRRSPPRCRPVAPAPPGTALTDRRSRLMERARRRSSPVDADRVEHGGEFCVDGRRLSRPRPRVDDDDRAVDVEDPQGFDLPLS